MSVDILIMWCASQCSVVTGLGGLWWSFILVRTFCCVCMFPLDWTAGLPTLPSQLAEFSPMIKITPVFFIIFHFKSGKETGKYRLLKLHREVINGKNIYHIFFSLQHYVWFATQTSPPWTTSFAMSLMATRVVTQRITNVRETDRNTINDIYVFFQMGK